MVHVIDFNKPTGRCLQNVMNEKYENQPYGSSTLCPFSEIALCCKDLYVFKSRTTSRSSFRNTDTEKHTFKKLFFYMVFFWHFITTMVLQRHDWVCTISGFCLMFCVCFWQLFRTLCAWQEGCIPIYKVVVRPDREWNSRPTNTEADALSTRPRVGSKNSATKKNNTVAKKCGIPGKMQPDNYSRPYQHI